ncbi:ketosteroid isomerase [Acidobacteria bacterium AB60]|nr:ketosteroid isomerase [Acidobacteria bacterium AB60]
MQNAEDIRKLLELWAENTRKGRLSEVLDHHAKDAVIYDVLPPLVYHGSEAYRESWGDWQPELEGEGEFELEDLHISASDDVGYAFGLIRCGGTYPDGRKLSDLVRATFCLEKANGKWSIWHQHISKPFSSASRTDQ